EFARQIEASADLVAERLDHNRPVGDRRLQSDLEQALPAWARVPGREILVTNVDGVVVAGVRSELLLKPDGPTITTVTLPTGTLGRRLIDVLGPAQPLTTFGAAAGVLEIALGDGTQAFAT